MAEAPRPLTPLQRPRSARQDRFGEIGGTGLKVYDGILTEEFRRELTGQDGVKIYREMSLNSPVVGAILFTIEQMVSQVDWKIAPFEEDNDQDEEQRLFVEECLDDMNMSWADTLSEICSMFDYGWAYLECVYKMRRGLNPGGDMPRSKFTDSKIGWRKWAIRGQDTLMRWEMDETGGIVGMTQALVDQGYQEITVPIRTDAGITKALLFRTRVNKNNPEGLSILRRAYVSWWYAKRLQEFEAIAHERDAAGLPVLTPPEGLDIWNENDPEMIRALSAATKLVQQLRRGEREGVVKPPGWTLELLSSTSRRPADLDKTIVRYETRIAMSVLADFIFLGQGSTGSWALSSDKTKMFVLALGGYLRRIKEVVNRFAIPSLLELNNMDASRPPRLEHGDIETQDLTALAAYLKAMVEVGAVSFPDTELERYLRTAADLPPPSEEPVVPEDWIHTMRQPPMEPEMPAAGEEFEKGEDVQSFASEEGHWVTIRGNPVFIRGALHGPRRHTHPEGLPEETAPGSEFTAAEQKERDVTIKKLDAIARNWLDNRTGGRDPTRQDLADLGEFLSTKYGEQINAITKDFDSKVKYPHRPGVHLVVGSEKRGVPDVWLLGWRETERGLEATPVHDHGKSEAGVFVHKGAVNERIFAIDKKEFGQDKMEFRTVDRGLNRGSGVTINAPYIHDIGAQQGKGTSVTVHSYYPPLNHMAFYEVQGKNLVKTGRWDEDPALEKKRSHIFPCYHYSVNKYHDGLEKRFIKAIDLGEKKSPELAKHLPGEHDQQTHGNRDGETDGQDIESQGHSWAKSLDETERQVVQDYSESYYSAWNGCLRKKTCTQDEMKNIERLSAAIAKSRTTSDVTVNRLMHAVVKVEHHFKPGAEFVDNGFMSTSLRKPAIGFMTEKGLNNYLNDAGAAYFEIRIPKGTEAAYLGWISKHPGEKEVLLNKGARVRINSVARQGKGYKIMAEVVT